jgi:hypothetical protein
MQIIRNLHSMTCCYMASCAIGIRNRAWPEATPHPHVVTQIGLGLGQGNVACVKLQT